MEKNCKRIESISNEKPLEKRRVWGPNAWKESYIPWINNELNNLEKEIYEKKWPKEFLLYYIESEIYLERLKERWYEDPEAEQIKRYNTVQETKIIKSDKVKWDMTLREMIMRSWNRWPDLTRSNARARWAVVVNTKQIEWISTFAEVLVHELMHKARLGWKYLTDQERNYLLNLNWKIWLSRHDLDHNNKPDEIISDLATLRFLMYNDEIFDAACDTFTNEHLQIIKQKYKNNYMFKRLFEQFNDDDFIEILNNIAMQNENTSDIENIA